MKTLLSVAFGFVAGGHLFAQGTVNFLNASSSAVTNALTGARLPTGTTFKVALYYLPDSSTVPTLRDFDRAGIILDPSSGFFAPGLYNGGTRTAPTATPGGFGWFQVRAWETAFGTSYEHALCSPPQNGRTPLIGTSNIIKVDTGDPTTSPPGAPGLLTAAGLKGFVLLPSAAWFSNISINDVSVTVAQTGTVNATFTVSGQLERCAECGLTESQLSVRFATADGTARAGVDYQTASGNVILSFPQGVTFASQTLTVPVLSHEVPESGKDFFVNLQTPCAVKNQGVCTIRSLRISAFSVDAVIGFPTISGHTYTVEKTDTLNPAVWRPLAGATGIAGNGSLVSITDKSAGCVSSANYRVRDGSTAGAIGTLSIDAVIAFRTLSGQTYAIDKTANLSPTNWQPLAGATSIAGTGGSITVSDRGAGCLTQGHYRLRLVP
jgi:hypothetical protein